MKQLLIIFMFVFLSESSFAQKYIRYLTEDSSKWIDRKIFNSDSAFVVPTPKVTIFIVDGYQLPKDQNLSNFDSLYTVHFYRQNQDTLTVLAETYANRPKSIDDLPENSFVVINDVFLEGKHFLQLLGHQNYIIDNLSRYKPVVDRNTIKYDKKVNGEVLASQVIPFLPKDFFVVKKYTLESIRYRCYAAVPLLDFFSSADDGFSITNKSKGVIFLVDGRPQSYDFDWKGFKPEDLRKVWVYDPTVATKFFGTKAQKGVVELITKNSKLRDGHFLRGIRVVGEQRNKNGTWQVIADTTMASLEAYQAFKKTKLLEQGPVYMINEKSETEFLNRKTIDIGHISDFNIRKEKRVYKETPKLPFSNSSELVVRAYSDTVFIKTSNDFRAVDRHTNPQIIMEELVKMRMPQIEETLPMYIIDDQEVSLEILQKYRQKDFETVDVLDKTEAIKTYGKKGENGAMIYKLKKKI